MATTWQNSGSYFYSPKLSSEMMEQALPMFIWRQFVDLSQELGKNKGDTVQYTKQLRIDSKGGTLVETNTFPTNRIRFIKDSCTVTEYGNGVECTEKATTLSTFDLKNKMNKGLMDDYKDTIDSAVSAQFKTADFKCVLANTATASFYTNGTATGTASANLSDKTARAIINYAKQKQIPKLGSYYVGILSTEMMGGLYDYLQAVAQYAQPEFRYNDEVGRYYGARWISENNYLDDTVGTSSYGEGVVFGDESVVEAVALPEELRYWEDDGGRSKKYVWYSILGFKKAWDLSTDDLNSTGKGIERIIHITSL